MAYESVTPCRDGSGIAVDAAIGIHRESSGAADREKAVHAINQRIFETSVDLILVVDRSGTFLRVSPSSMAILGYEPGEMVGRSAAEFLYSEDLDNTRNEMRLARRCEAARSFECRYVHKQGRIVTLEWTGVWSPPEEQHFFIGRDISDRKEIERRLSEAQQANTILREGINGMPEGFAIYDNEARLVICNESYRRLFPTASSVIVPGVQFETILREGLARGFFPDAQGREEEWISDRLRQHHSEHGTIEQHLSDGRCVLVSKHQMANGWTMGLRVDVTTLKATQQALEESESSFNYLFQNSPLPMWVYELSSLRFLAVNHAAISTYGFSRNEFIAMRITDIRPEDDLDRLFQTVADATPYLQTSGWRHRTKGGRELDVDIYSHRLDFDGRPARMVVALDVTARKTAEVRLAAENSERRRAEAEVRVLNAELERRVAARTVELEVANRELESFAYSISHDLRAPLRHMDGFSQALIEDYGNILDDNAKRFLERIRVGSIRMGHLIDDLLKLSRVSRGGLERERVQLSKIAFAIIDELREAEPNRLVTVEIAPDMEVIADARLMRVALSNLLGNAWKFTKKTPDARIEFGLASRVGAAAYFIHDNGVGFDMTYVNKLFVPFQRLHTSEEFEGTGIGLATVSRVFHRHGGKVEIESAVGKGTTVCFTI
jgi:hypothetical protein